MLCWSTLATVAFQLDLFASTRSERANGMQDRPHMLKWHPILLREASLCTMPA